MKKYFRTLNFTGDSGNALWNGTDFKNLVEAIFSFIHTNMLQESSMHFTKSLYIPAFLFSLASPTYAALVYNEANTGDLSGNRLAPTFINISPGDNLILGATGGSNTGVDRDYFTITIAANQQLTAITLLPNTTVGGEFSFIGIASGKTVSTNPADFTAAGLLGWWHYGAGDINTDILSQMTTPSLGSSGFTAPLGAGDYAFWVQDFNPGVISYGFNLTVANLNIAPVPLPTGLVTFLSGLAMLSTVRRKTKT